MNISETYCNPIPFPDYPWGQGDESIHVKDSDRRYHSLSDPDGFFEDGICYLFTSYGGVYTSGDMLHWKREKVVGIPDVFDGPAVQKIKGKYYFIGNQTALYRSDDPLGPYQRLGYMRDCMGKEFKINDPDLFVAPDGRCYLYWGCSDGKDGILGAELDPENPIQLLTEPTKLFAFDPEHEWERWGEYNQDDTIGWIEGCCMLYYDKKYFLFYSGCGTTYSGYATGVYVSDSPLEGFVYAENNPIIRKRYGLVRGGGHSCILDDGKGQLYAFYTCKVAYSQRFERVIAMDVVKYFEGRMHVTGTEVPCFRNGENCKELRPLSFYVLSDASSVAEGRDAVFAIDDNILSYWQPAVGDKLPWLSVDLRGDYQIGAVRVMKRDLLKCTEERWTMPLRYRIEVQDGEEWRPVFDCMNREEDLMIDYQTFPYVKASKVRLVLPEVNEERPYGIVNFTVFGKKLPR